MTMNSVIPSAVKRSETQSRDPVGFLGTLAAQTPNGFPRLRCAALGMTAILALVLGACQTTPHTRLVSGKVRTGQMRYSGPQRSIVGEFVLCSSPYDFQLEVSKGPSTLMSVREIHGETARFEGGGRSWQGRPQNAPKPLRNWLALDDVFAGRAGDGSWTARRTGSETAVVFPKTGERFVFHFNNSGS